MRKLACFVILLVSTMLAAKADVKQGTGVYFMFNDLKYEILDEDAHTAAVAVQDADCPTYVRIYGAISITDDQGVDHDYTVVQINPEAFMGNKDLFKVKFATTITDIGDRAFKDCEIVNFDELPARLETIGEEAFKGCNAVKRIKLPESTVKLGNRCFAEMAQLKRVILFGAVTELPEWVLYNNFMLDEVYLPENLTKIGECAFKDCRALTELVFPSTIEEIEASAFEGCPLRNVVLPPNVTLSEQAFINAGILTLDLCNLEQLPDYAFNACSELREVTFSPNLKSIGKMAFGWCAPNAAQPMNDLVIPESVETIEETAFQHAYITSLTIGDKVKNLPVESCGIPIVLHLGSGIKSIDPKAVDFERLQIIQINALIPPSVTGGFPLTAEQQHKITVIVADEDAKEMYEAHEHWKEFYIVVAQKEDVVVHLNGTSDIATAIHSVSGMMPASVTRLKISGHITDTDFQLIKENMVSLTHLDMGEADNTIIPESAFENKSTLTKVILPRGLKRIEGNAFSNCSAMNISEFPETIEYIGNRAFFTCSRITVSKMPDALREIGGSAFYDCVSLKSLIFGENLESIEGGVFHTCHNLEYVDLSKSKIKVLPNQGFILAYNLKTLLLPETLEKIEYESIAETGMKTLDIPGNFNELEYGGLSRTNIRVLTFGEGIETIPDEALAGNERLLTVNLPSSLKSMHEGSFKGSTNIVGISCLAIEAPEASAATFEDVNSRTCILSIPVPSFYSYLSTPGWGMFSNISNTLEVDIPEDVDVTTIPEEDYQDLAEEEESQEREQGNAEDNEENENEDPAPQSKSAVKRLMAQKQREVSNSLLGGQLFCKLSHGTVLASEADEESKGHRVFIRSKNGQPITSVMVNGVEMVDQLDQNNSIVIAAGSLGKLVVNGGPEASIDDINVYEPNAETICDVYSFTGQHLYTGRMGSINDNLTSGIYIVKPQNNGKAIKMAVK